MSRPSALPASPAEALRGPSPAWPGGAPLGFAVPLLLLILLLTACDGPRPVQIPLGETGERLSGLYWEPPGERAPGILLLHPQGGRKEEWTGFANQLRKAGFAVLAVDLREQGRTSSEQVVADAAAGFDFLRLEKKVDAARIALVGADLGANGALVFAAQEPLVRSVALLSPGLNTRGLATEPALRDYGARPLFLAATEDDFVSAQAARRLAAQAQGEVTLKLYPGTAHGIELLAPVLPLASDVLHFLESSL